MRIDFGHTPDSVMVSIARSGIASVNGSGGGGALLSFALAGGTFDATGVVEPVTDPAAFPILGIRFDGGNEAGTFGAGGGVMPLAGYARFCLFEPCGALPPSNLSVPLDVVGVGGAATMQGNVDLTVVGAPWTTGTASAGTLTRMGSVGGPASNASTAAVAGGHVQLVTPIFLYTSLNPAGFTPGFATLTLHFVPEPASLALVALGAAGLSIAASRRRR